MNNKEAKKEMNAVVTKATNEVKPAATNEVKPAATAKQEATAPKVEEVKKQIEEMQKELDKCLKELEHKKLLAAHRDIFLKAKDDIKNVSEAMKMDNTFETTNCILKLFNSPYNNSPILTISNREILIDLLDFIDKKIDSKVEKIELELIQ